MEFLSLTIATKDTINITSFIMNKQDIKCYKNSIDIRNTFNRVILAYLSEILVGAEEKFYIYTYFLNQIQTVFYINYCKYFFNMKTKSWFVFYIYC